MSTMGVPIGWEVVNYWFGQVKVKYIGSFKNAWRNFTFKKFHIDDTELCWVAFCWLSWRHELHLKGQTNKIKLEDKFKNVQTFEKYLLLSWPSAVAHTFKVLEITNFQLKKWNGKLIKVDIRSGWWITDLKHKWFRSSPTPSNRQVSGWKIFPILSNLL